MSARDDYWDRVRAVAATIPPLTEEQRETLGRVLAPKRRRDVDHGGDTP